MNIFDYAMQLEKKGESYYRRLVEGTHNKGLQSIFGWLADEEVKHYRIFEAMRAGTTAAFAETAILQDAKKVFEQMKGRPEVFHFDDRQIEAYRKAQEIERKSQDFYQEKAKLVTDPEQRQILLQAAEEEKRHYFLLENIIQFVSRPQLWLENAEFYQLEKY